MILLPPRRRRRGGRRGRREGYELRSAAALEGHEQLAAHADQGDPQPLGTRIATALHGVDQGLPLEGFGKCAICACYGC